MGYRKYIINVEVKDYQNDGYSKEVAKLEGAFKLDEPLLFDSNEDVQLAKEILTDAMKTVKSRLDELNKENIAKEANKKDSDYANDTEEPNDMNYDDEDDEEYEEVEYSASASFTADIEYEFTSNEQEIDKQKVLRKAEKSLDNDDVYIEDYDEENIIIEHIKDNEYKLIIKDANFSTGVTVTGYSFDQCNDDRWSAFWNKVNCIKCLTNVRDEYVSEVD